MVSVYHILQADASGLVIHIVNWFIEKIIKFLSDALLQFPHSPRPCPGGSRQNPEFPWIEEHLAQSAGMSRTLVTVDNVNQAIHNVTMTIDQLDNVTRE